MFKSAKIKLTTWYLVIIMAITLTFSSIVYVGVIRATQRALEFQRHRIEVRYNNFLSIDDGVRPSNFNEETFEEIKAKVLLILGAVNLFIFVIAGGLGYFLAGKTLEPIENILKKQKRFISDAAHEMRTPLTAMKTELEVAIRGKNLDQNEFKRTLQSTVEEVDKLNVFMERLLDQSKYQNVDTPTNLVDFNLKDLTQNTIDKLKNLNINSDLNDVMIRANETGIEEVITNILDNAIKYSPIDKKINVSLIKVGNFAVLKIIDSGKGIDQKDLQNIFEPFYRADESRSKANQKGYGLGLAITKEIVEKHGGKMEALSELEKGSTFIIKLPALG